MLVVYFPLRADDAYIVARYARNAAAGFGIVFNEGERVNALTSPFHFAVLLGFRWLGGDWPSLYRVVSGVAVLVGLACLGLRRWGLSGRSALFLSIALASPFLAFWTVGGLETPILVLVLTVFASAVVWDPEVKEGWLRGVIVVAATLAVFTRYDAVLITAPVVVAVLWESRHRLGVWLAFAGCALAFLAWVAFTYAYFGDPLPTSFHVKLGTDVYLGPGAIYAGSFLVLSWIWIPALMSGGAPAPWRSSKVHLALCLGLAITLMYTVLAGTKHMMYAYRLFIPYLPVLALLTVDRISLASDKFALRLSVVIVIAQAAMGAFIYYYSENPSLALLVEGRGTQRTRFEFSHTAARHTSRFLDIVESQARQIPSHWAAQPDRPDRPPRLFVRTGGMVPWVVPDSYVLEELVSFRHRCRPDLEPMADYVQMIYSGRDAPAAETMRKQQGRTVIAHDVLMAGGLWPEPMEVHVATWFGPTRQGLILPERVDMPCTAPR